MRAVRTLGIYVSWVELFEKIPESLPTSGIAVDVLSSAVKVTKWRGSDGQDLLQNKLDNTANGQDANDVTSPVEEIEESRNIAEQIALAAEALLSFRCDGAQDAAAALEKLTHPCQMLFASDGMTGNLELLKM